MPTKRKVRKIAVRNNLRKCPSCGYTDGFHVMFSRKRETAKQFRMLLCCPMCSDTVDMGIRLDGRTGE